MRRWLRSNVCFPCATLQDADQAGCNFYGQQTRTAALALPQVDELIAFIQSYIQVNRSSK